MNTDFRDMIRRNNWIVLDTETTGLKYPSEACQIAIVNWLGETLLDTLVKPTRPIPLDAIRIHEITNADVRDAPTFDKVLPQIQQAIAGRDLIIYNAGYDTNILTWSAELAGLRFEAIEHANSVWCAMLAYAEYWGDWNDYYQSYRWQSLTAATRQQGLEIIDAHSAVGDCIMTRNLILKVIADMARRELANQAGGQ